MARWLFDLNTMVSVSIMIEAEDKERILSLFFHSIVIFSVGLVSKVRLMSLLMERPCLTMSLPCSNHADRRDNSTHKPL